MSIELPLFFSEKVWRVNKKEFQCIMNFLFIRWRTHGFFGFSAYTEKHCE
ncbi:hypothetical protein DDI_1790 [Dickeya dianthicola RNS04.9]|nr:hypothetical protein DDI_1790 [Dickeya dianthicola RNS04.9]